MISPSKQTVGFGEWFILFQVIYKWSRSSNTVHCPNSSRRCRLCACERNQRKFWKIRDRRSVASILCHSRVILEPITVCTDSLCIQLTAFDSFELGRSSFIYSALHIGFRVKIKVLSSNYKLVISFISLLSSIDSRCFKNSLDKMSEREVHLMQ